MPERNVLLRVTGDNSQGKNSLREIGAELVRLTAKDYVAKLGLDDKGAAAKIEALRARLGNLSGEAKVDLRIDGAQAKLEILRARLARLSTLAASPDVRLRIGTVTAQIVAVETSLKDLDKQKAQPRVNVRGEKALADLDRIEAALKVLGARKVSTKVEAKVKLDLASVVKAREELKHSLAGGQFSSPLESVLKDVSKLGDGLVQVGFEAAKAGGDFRSFVTSTVTGAQKVASSVASSLVETIGSAFASFGSTIALVAGAIVLIGPAILLLVGALGALVAVLLSATAGAAALGVALLAALGPVGALLVFVVSQITKATAAQQAATRAVSTAHSAQIALAQAESNRAKAGVAASTQRIAAIQAEKDAILGLENAQNAVANAQLGVTGARLNLDQAEQDLKAFANTAGTAGNSLARKFADVAASKLPGVLDGVIASGGSPAATALAYQQKLFAVKTALQGVQNSELAVANAQDQHSKAQAVVNDFQSKGLAAYGGYNSALGATVTAQRNVEKSTLALQRAEAARAKALDNLTPAQTKLASELKKFSTDITNALGPAADKVLGPFADGLKAIVKFASSPGVQAGLDSVGKALGFVVRALSAKLNSAGAQAAFKAFADGGAALTRVFGGGLLPDLLRFLLAIAREALPALLGGARGLAKPFHAFVDAEIHSGALHRQIKLILGALKSVGGLAGASIGLLASLFPTATKAGGGLVDSLTRLIEKETRFLGTKAGQERLKQFFRDAKTEVHNLTGALNGTVSALNTIRDIVNGLVDGFKAITAFVKFGPVGRFVSGIAGAAGGAAGTQGGIFSKIKGGFKSFLDEISHADGGITTRASLGVIGEAGPEAVLPLRADVLSRLGAAIAQFVPHYPTLDAVTGGARGAVRAPAGNRNTTVNITAPAGHWPDMGHAMAVIDQRLNAIGA